MAKQYYIGCVCVCVYVLHCVCIYVCAYIYIHTYIKHLYSFVINEVSGVASTSLLL